MRHIVICGLPRSTFFHIISQMSRFSLKTVNEDKMCFFLCVTVHHWYNNINSQPGAITTNFTDNYNQINMFRAEISLILRSTRLCLQLVVWSTDDAACRQHRRCVIPQSSAPEDERNFRPKHVDLIAGSIVGALYHSLVLLRMSEISARNMLIWLQAASSVRYTTSCKHSLVLLRMSEISARNMLIWL